MEKEFEKAALALVQSKVFEQGYEFSGSYSYPRGDTLEFQSGDRHLFLSFEDHAVYIELFIPCSTHDWIRIDINGAFFYAQRNGLRDSKTWMAALSYFARHIAEVCGSFFSDSQPDLDSRFCYSMSHDAFNKRLKFQRSE